MKQIAMHTVVSSLIAAFGYDAESKTLRVAFMPSKKQMANDEPGPAYDYEGVEPETYEALTQAESAGKFFLTNIKKQFVGIPVRNESDTTNPTTEETMHREDKASPAAERI